MIELINKVNAYSTEELYERLKSITDKGKSAGYNEIMELSMVQGRIDILEK